MDSNFAVAWHVQDLAHVCPSVHKTLEGLRSVAAAKRRIIDDDSLSEPEKAQKVGD
jgi:hypothetical protein